MPGQTRSTRSLLLTSSVGRDSSASKMSKARALTSTGTPSFDSSLSFTTMRKGPKDMISLFCAAGVIVGVVIGVLFLSSALVGRGSLKYRFRSLADADRWGQSIWRQGDATTRAEVEIA